MKHCHKCDKDFAEEDSFCGECGSKLTKHKETKKEVEKHHTPKNEKSTYKFSFAPWAIPWVVIGILIIIAGVILLPTKVVSYQIEVPYIDKETYTVQVSYEDIEEYTVQVTEEVKKQEKVEVPIVAKKTAQVLSIHGEIANIMDNENFETFDLKIPEELEDQVKEGVQVSYWIILGEKILKQVK